MVRDIHKDKDYWDKYVADEERVFKKSNNFTRLYNIAKGMYSRGDDVALVKEAFIKYLNIWENEADITIFNISEISLMILCDMDTLLVLERYNKLALERCKKNKNTLYYDDYDDWLFHYLISKGEDNLLSRGLLEEKKYESLKLFIESGDVNHFKTFLKNWYNKSKPSENGWKGDHKLPDDRLLYNGYWNFEGAAVVKLLGLNKDEFKDYKYFPYDLV